VACGHQTLKKAIQCNILQHTEGKNTPGFSNLYQMERKLTEFEMEAIAKPNTKMNLFPREIAINPVSIIELLFQILKRTFGNRFCFSRLSSFGL
jgi:hypothetical protein